MSLFSKVFFVIGLSFYCSAAWGLNVKALYTSACKRELGLILDVDEKNITFLSVNRSVIKMPRYELIYLADYPIDVLPTRGRLNVTQAPLVKVSILDNHQEKPLLEGWPIGFNAEKIAFLRADGAETVIDSENIWSIEFVEGAFGVQSRRAPKSYRFIHPYAFRDCSYPNKGRNIYPQQILSDPVQIKRELDVLRDGFDRVRRYEREQDFYPVPQVYENKTELGIWYSFGSRSGASDKRNNNLLPVLVDQYSSDIFDYQHYSVTGAAPLFVGTHEEPQSQIYYTFKASYFHFSIMVDPDIVLVGENYDWQAQDFNGGQSDTRHNDVTIVELGFDFGAFSFRGYGGSVINLGLWDGSRLLVESMGVPRIGLRYTHHRWWAEVNGGSGSKSLEAPNGELDVSFSRLNVGISDWKRFDVVFSLINMASEAPLFSALNSKSTIFAAYLSRPVTKRVRAGGFLSNESTSNSTSVSSNDQSYFKGGVSLFLNF